MSSRIRIAISKMTAQASHRWMRLSTLIPAVCLFLPIAALAQSGSPFDTGFTSIQMLFTGTIAKVASLVAIVIGGYGFAHGEPGAKKTKTGRLWTYVRDDRPAGEVTAPAVWFAYSEDRKGEHPRQHQKNFKGGLQADAYAGFHHLYGDGAIYEVACWAHARRKFHEIHVINASPTTTGALARIGALYAIEDEVRGKPADLRLSVRQARARPLLNDLRKWMEKALRSMSAKSETAGAIRYALSRWRALTRYTDDGLFEIDNSAAERALRAVALGRKNYYSPVPIAVASVPPPCKA